MIFKVCKICYIEKSFDLFTKDKRKPDGLGALCKQCKSEYDAKYRESNKERLKDQSKQRYLENKKEHNRKSKENYIKNKDKYLLQCKIYTEKNRELIAARAKKYREVNREAIRQRNRLKYLKNKDLIKSKVKQRYESNRDAFYANNAKRRAMRRNATPSWLSKSQLDEIREFYTITQLFRLYTGQEYHVDHIIPLKNDLVCGLHVPWNLQILTAEENLSKHNHFEIT